MWVPVLQHFNIWQSLSKKINKRVLKHTWICMGHIQGMPPKIPLFFFRSMMCSLEELRSEMKLSLQERGGEFTLEKKGDEHKTSGENRLFLTVWLGDITYWLYQKQTWWICPFGLGAQPFCAMICCVWVFLSKVGWLASAGMHHGLDDIWLASCRGSRVVRK